jgi:Alternative complex III, ActD subunit
MTMKKQAPYGLMAEFESPEELVKAAEKTYESGYRKIDAYSPFPIEGLAEAIGFHKSRVPLVCLIGGLVGCSGGFFLQWWPNVIGYPLNIGGKPFNSWPSFIPITFELTILIAGLSTVAGMIAMNGLPEPYHPVFNCPQFNLASQNRFFLCIMAEDARFDIEKTREFLQGMNSQGVYEVEP